MKFITLIFLIYLIFMRPSYAYMDPGSLTILLQVIISGIVGALVYIKIFSKKIKNFINKVFLKFRKKEKKNNQ